MRAILCDSLPSRLLQTRKACLRCHLEIPHSTFQPSKSLHSARSIYVRAQGSDRQVVSTDKAPGAVGPYSQAIRAGDTVYVSGQVGLIPGTKDLAGEDVEVQTEQVMKNLGAVLEAAGSSYEQVLKTTVLLTTMSDFQTVNAIYGKYFSKDPPARACFAVKELPLGAKALFSIMVATRSQRAAHVRQVLDVFPDELWVEVMSNLRGKDLGRAACVSRKFASLRDYAWQAACAKRWPRWFQIARAPDTLWRRQYELLELREREEAAVPSVAAIRKLQRAVNSRHRTVLTEWLAEVSWDWDLDSVVVFKAVTYLDHYLAANEVEVLARFQLVGIACLRAAMCDSRVKLQVRESDKDLDPSRFSYISDRTYTPAQVEELTAVIQAETPAHVKTAPNAKMFLRSFWYRAVIANIATSEEMHIYTLASFYLQLGLLDLECTVFPASNLAAAALSNALEVFGRAAWFPALQHYSAYTHEELLPCKSRQRAAQATLAAEHLRVIWRLHHENHDYKEFQEEWAKVLLLIACPCK